MIRYTNRLEDAAEYDELDLLSYDFAAGENR